MPSFLDSIRNEWKLAADSIIVDGSDLAAEMDFNFAGHEQEASAKYQAMAEIQKARAQVGEAPKLMSSFVNGWYSARNSCTAQGNGHGAHSLGPNFGNFQNNGPAGPEMGG